MVQFFFDEFDRISSSIASGLVEQLNPSAQPPPWYLQHCGKANARTNVFYATPVSRRCLNNMGDPSAALIIETLGGLIVTTKLQWSYAIVVYRSSTQPLPLGKSVFCITETLMPAATDTRFPFPDRTHYSPRVSVSFIGRSFTIASDAVALLVIWCCIPEGFQSTRTLSWSTKLTAFLWVNGTSTFAFLLLLNLLDLVLDATLVAYGTNGPVFNPFPTLITPITTITILRFTIHLRKVATASQGTQHAATQHVPTVISAPSITPAQRSYGSVIRWIPSGSMQTDWRAPASFGAVASVQDLELGTLARPEEMSPSEV
ncbi:hypothetical protein FOMPIDRAFT_1050051 [Fomitopsis schrenkii]|uniref:Uncharacterized protein n=1 Tax=Fomitopsis schrenkii TaxID=2126942 RepID=S8FEN3_FOMSC|nr:hypothetical protein FOMPIDRAFT_1050051 [Fomitopsis schrenkii]